MELRRAAADDELAILRIADGQRALAIGDELEPFAPHVKPPRLRVVARWGERRIARDEGELVGVAMVARILIGSDRPGIECGGRIHPSSLVRATLQVVGHDALSGARA